MELKNRKILLRYGENPNQNAYLISNINKSIFDLDIHEYAYLAALPKGPNNYDPNKNYKRALDRRNYVLKQMELNKFITSSQFNYYSNLEIKLFKKDNKK